MSEKKIEYTTHDYEPLNKAIDENLRIKRTRSIWGYAKSVALILIALGILALLLAWAYSLINKHYILKRVAGVQERVIEEKINEAVSSSGISNNTNKLRMLGDNQIAIEELDKAKEELAREKEKNQDLVNQIENTKDQMKSAALELEKSVGKVSTFESQKLALLTKQKELENELAGLKEENKERDKILEQLEELKDKNKNIKDDFYLFIEEQIKVNNKSVRVMTRYKYRDLSLTRPSRVDCYADFNPSFGVRLADLEMGAKGKDFNFDKVFSEAGFTKNQFVKVKKENCKFLN